ncbi:MAG TPA: AEC family transporter [Xanthobacteraceae bacterium]|jgi:predicted permease|nr:AEC family transporter [Xanthobacteraceae bacterium]
MYWTLLSTLVPVTVPVILGYLWVRFGRPYDGSTFGQLVSDVSMPCLVFSALAKADITPDSFGQMAMASLVCLVLLATIGAAGLYLARLRVRTYLSSVTWGNYGFFGIPLAYYAFGESGIAYAVVFSAVSHAFNSPLSQIVCVASVRPHALLSVIIRTPLVYAVAAGIAIASLHLRLPDAVVRSASLLGGIAIPTMLIMVGASLARLRPICLGRAVVFSIIRVVVGIAIAVIVAQSFGLPSTAKHVLVLQCAMPVAVLSYVFAQRWNNEPDEIANLVAVSTWSASFTVPLTLFFLLR